MKKFKFKSWRWCIRHLQPYYFKLMFSIGGFLFIGNKCPNCGGRLRFNSKASGECNGVYCTDCIRNNVFNHGLSHVKTFWTFSELYDMEGHAKERQDEWVSAAITAMKRIKEIKSK